MPRGDQLTKRVPMWIKSFSKRPARPAVNSGLIRQSSTILGSRSSTDSLSSRSSTDSLSRRNSSSSLSSRNSADSLSSRSSDSIDEGASSQNASPRITQEQLDVIMHLSEQQVRANLDQQKTIKRLEQKIEELQANEKKPHEHTKVDTKKTPNESGEGKQNSSEQQQSTDNSEQHQDGKDDLFANFQRYIETRLTLNKILDMLNELMQAVKKDASDSGMKILKKIMLLGAVLVLTENSEKLQKLKHLIPDWDFINDCVDRRIYTERQIAEISDSKLQLDNLCSMLAQQKEIASERKMGQLESRYCAGLKLYLDDLTDLDKKADKLITDANKSESDTSKHRKYILAKSLIVATNKLKEKHGLTSTFIQEQETLLDSITPPEECTHERTLYDETKKLLALHKRVIIKDVETLKFQIKRTDPIKTLREMTADLTENAQKKLLDIFEKSFEDHFYIDDLGNAAYGQYATSSVEMLTGIGIFSTATGETQQEEAQQLEEGIKNVEKKTTGTEQPKPR